MMRKRSRNKMTAVLSAFILTTVWIISPCLAAENGAASGTDALASETAEAAADTEETVVSPVEDETGRPARQGGADVPNPSDAEGRSMEEEVSEDDSADASDDFRETQQQTVSEKDIDADDTVEDPDIPDVPETEDAGEPLETVEMSEDAEVLDATATYVLDFSTNTDPYITYNEYATGQEGYISGKYCADAAYLGSSGDNYIFMASGVIGTVSKSKVSLRATSSIKSLSYYYVSSGKLYHRLTKNLLGTTYSSSLNQGNAPSYLKAGTNYYSYDGHYFYTTYASMIADYVNDTRSHSVNPGSPFYNYYQFLPLRSGAIYTADQLNKVINSKLSSTSVMKNIGSTLITCQNAYGVNALLAASIAINESGWGNSEISRTKNNLFGLNAVDTSPGQSANYYSSTAVCVKDFTETYMSKQYLNPSSWKYNGGYLGNKASGINVKYSSDPYWGEKAANYAYYLENDLTAKDSYRYTIAVKDPIAKLKTKPNSSLAVRSSASNSATKIYTAKGLFSVSFILKDGTSSSGGFYRIQSDPVLNSGRTAIDKNTGEYNFAGMYGYVPTASVSVVIRGSGASDIVQKKNGVLKAGDGNWYYYENDKINYQYTGVAKNSNGWWRIENGKVNFNFHGFAQNSNGWWYLTGGKVQFDTNDVIKGTVNNITGWWLVSGGKVTFTETVAKNKNGWWYIEDGRVDFGYSGVAKNGNGWWRIENGKVNFNFNGFAENKNGWWYLTGGKVQFNTNDVIKGTVKGTAGWWFVSGGKVTFTETVAKNKNGWWYIKDGKVDFTYTGIGKNSYGLWYINKGKVNFSYNGIVTVGQLKYRVKNGKAEKI